MTFILDGLNQRFRALLRQQLEDSGICHQGESQPLIIAKEQWLQAQSVSIQKLARGMKL